MSRTRKNSPGLRGLLCLAVLAVCLCGCWDRREINDVGFVMASGIDYGQDGRYLVTTQIAVPTAMSQSSRGTGNSGAEPVMLVHATAKTLGEIELQVQAQMSRKYNSSHRRVLIIGEEAAKHGLKEIIDHVSRFPTNRLRVYLIVAKGGTARGLLELQYPLEAYPAEGIRELNKLEHGKTTTLRDFFISASMTGFDPVIPSFVMTGNNVHRFKHDGMAVFHDLKLAGYLNRTESQVLMLMRDALREGEFEVSVPTGGPHPIAVTIKDTTCKPSVEVQNGKPIVTYHIKINGNVTGNSSNLDLLNPIYLRELNAAWNQLAKQQCQAMIKHLQQLKSDAIGVGAEIYRHQPDLWTQQLEKNWDDEQFAKQEIRVDIETQIEQIGMMGPPLQLRDEEVRK